MPRHDYWTIILEGAPTAFRARTREELLPTLKQLQSRHPDTLLKWFARGRLWNSPEEAREFARAKRSGALYRDRGRDWRPGGDHRDPRDRFKRKRRQERHTEGSDTHAPRGSAPRARTGGSPRFDSRQRRPYRPTGGSRRGGGGKGRP